VIFGAEFRPGAATRLSAHGQRLLLRGGGGNSNRWVDVLYRGQLLLLSLLLLLLLSSSWRLQAEADAKLIIKSCLWRNWTKCPPLKRSHLKVSVPRHLGREPRASFGDIRATTRQTNNLARGRERPLESAQQLWSPQEAASRLKPPLGCLAENFKLVTSKWSSIVNRRPPASSALICRPELASKHNNNKPNRVVQVSHTVRPCERVRAPAKVFESACFTWCQNLTYSAPIAHVFLSSAPRTSSSS